MQTLTPEPQANLMLARYYSPAGTFRFASVDPGDDTYLDIPQSWNKYAYVRNNPIAFADPTGMKLNLETDKKDQKALKKRMKEGMTREEKRNIKVDKKTGAVTLKDPSMQGTSPQYKYTAAVINDDNTANVQLVHPGETATGSATGVQRDFQFVSDSGGGVTDFGPSSGADGGADVDITLTDNGNRTGFLPGQNYNGTAATLVPDPPFLVAQHEIVGEGLQAMQGPKPAGGYSRQVPVDRENEIRDYMGISRRGSYGHQ